MSKLKEQKIALLKAARKNIKSRRDDFVCIALQMCYDDSNEGAYKSLRKYIQKALKGEYTLGDWQVSHGVDSNNRRSDRVKWIDWMIASLEGKV
jgi:hypothetical protein